MRPDPTHLARLASPHRLVADGHLVLDRGDAPGAAVDTGLDAAAGPIRAEPAATGGILHARHRLYLSPSAASITAQRVGEILPSSHP